MAVLKQASDQAVKTAEEAERTAASAVERATALEDADRRAEEARHALVQIREEGERQTTLAAGQVSLAPPSVDGDGEPAAQFDDHLRGCHAPSRLLPVKRD